MPALALPLVLCALQRGVVVVNSRLPPPGKLHRDVKALLLPAGNNGPALVARLNGFVDRQLSRKQVQQALLHGVALAAAPQYQLHGASPKAWRR